MTANTIEAVERDRIAQEAAEHIASVLIPAHDEFAGLPGVTVTNLGPEPPRDVETIKAWLLDGRMQISWMDDVINAAMRKLHGPPTGDAEFLFGED